MGHEFLDDGRLLTPADFAILSGDANVRLYIDGLQWHSSGRHRALDNNRTTNRLQMMDYLVLRFLGGEVHHDPQARVRQIKRGLVRTPSIGQSGRRPRPTNEPPSPRPSPRGFTNFRPLNRNPATECHPQADLLTVPPKHAGPAPDESPIAMSVEPGNPIHSPKTTSTTRAKRAFKPATISGNPLTGGRQDECENGTKHGIDETNPRLKPGTQASTQAWSAREFA